MLSSHKFVSRLGIWILSSSVSYADLFSFSVPAPVLTPDEWQLREEELGAEFIFLEDPLLSPHSISPLAVAKPYPRSGPKNMAQDIKAAPTKASEPADPLPEDIVNLAKEEVQSEHPSVLRDMGDVPVEEKLTCESSWPSSLKAGESMDANSFLEACEWVSNQVSSSSASLSNGQMRCVCAHATVERLRPTVGSPIAHFVLKSGRAPVAAGPRGKRIEVGVRGKKSQGSESSGRLLWSSALPDHDLISHSLERQKDTPAPLERLFFALRSDGNLLLSRQLQSTQRREIIWESSSGGDLHNRYSLTLKCAIPSARSSVEPTLTDAKAQTVSPSSVEGEVVPFYFQVVEGVDEVNGTATNERVVYSSLEGVILPSSSLLELDDLSDSALGAHSLQPLDKARRFFKGIFSKDEENY